VSRHNAHYIAPLASAHADETDGAIGRSSKKFAEAALDDSKTFG
jgi:hypothetical protein